MSAENGAGGALGHPAADGADAAPEEDSRREQFRDLFAKSEARIAALFGRAGGILEEKGTLPDDGDAQDGQAATQDAAQSAAPPKRAARTIAEDDYGDDDEDADEPDSTASPAKPIALSSLPTSGAPPTSAAAGTPAKPNIERASTASSSEQLKSADDVRKKLEEDKKAAEEAARRSFHTLFYTLESDRGAMLEQQRLDEIDRQVEAEASGQNAKANNATANRFQQGSLSTENLGASNLTMKHLIAQLDKNRHKVPPNVTNSELHSLINEVRKGRGKWASEERVGQEELYEAAEKVLLELKAQTEYATPFLTKVQKKDAPDYHLVIKHPMDISTMLRKLRNLSYKSKREFVDDLNLIWANCLRYNSDPNHPIRKKALYMRKETDKLVPLIPDITVRDRAEVEAEERRLQNGAADGDQDESEDEEPIAVRLGRVAPTTSKKGAKGTNNARKAPSVAVDGTPGAETKPPMAHLGSNSALRNDFLRADSDAPLDLLATPPPGTLTPFGGAGGSAAAGSQADVSDVDGVGVNALGTEQNEDPEEEDLEYKTWKMVTKKARAQIAAERNRLFRGDRLNPEEPALLRRKAGMRRWMREQKQALEESQGDGKEASTGTEPASRAGETIAEGIEEDEERVVPDYYDPLSAIPELDDRLKWVTDDQGNVIEQSEEFLRVLPKGQFTSPESALTRKMDSNMRQMQETRKVCTKIGVVKQMQLQSQMYQNQFNKYDPQPFEEQDVGPVVTTDDGPVMSQWTCRAALQRSVGKIFYHAGFEEFQPSALEAVTDLASDFFTGLVKTLGVYRETPMEPVEQPDSSALSTSKPAFSMEEVLLQTLHHNSQDIEALDTYVKEDMDRVGSKLGVMHDRMKSHLAELLRPALDPNTAGADGVGAFNDGSEQFVGGDFADEIGEDFFGFKELGLDKEFGLASNFVPLHLLHNRMHSLHTAQNAATTSTTGLVMENPEPVEPVTIDNITREIGIVQGFFLAKLHANNDQPLVEDEDLPIKQRFPKPRLPPTGKISSPRKRPLREQQQMAKKRRKLEEGAKEETNGGGPNGVQKGLPKPVGKLKLEMPSKDRSNDGDPEREDGSAVGMMSPESIAAA